MLIGELSRRTGLPRDTIRFYEKIGMITAGNRPANTRQYKEYAEETVERLEMIAKGKTLGFTLNEMKQLLNKWPSDTMPSSEQIKIVEEKLEETTEKMKQLSDIQAYLSNKLSTLKQTIALENQ